ncbi:MAG: glycosyltransferase [Sedimentitalea sp.]
MPSILFIHENFPAQFGGIASHLAGQGWTVIYATAHEHFVEGRLHRRPQGYDVLRYKRGRETRNDSHRYLVGTERAVLNGQGLARAAYSLKATGFEPDVIVAHSGWGSGSFAKIVWPNAPLIQYLEWWYNWPGTDTLPEESSGTSEDNSARTLARNLPFLLDFQQAAKVWMPTHFQAKQVPDFVRDNTIVQHDGVNCDIFRPAIAEDKRFSIRNLPNEAPIATFATRGMEPMRGFPTFMAAAAKLQSEHKDLHIVVAGGDKTHYGRKPKGSKSWKQHALKVHDFDPKRLHFTGLLPKPTYTKLLQRTQAHVYLTRPFVLSWSLIEAAATACPLVVGDVAPVREALPDDDLAKFVPLDDHEALSDGVDWCLKNQKKAHAMGLRARKTICERYHQPISFDALELMFRKVITKSKSNKTRGAFLDQDNLEPAIFTQNKSMPATSNTFSAASGTTG